MNISVAPEALFSIGGFAVTNTMTTAMLLTLLFLVFGFYFKASFGLVPTRMQVLFELAVEFLDEQMHSAFNSKRRVRQLFPMIGALLLFIFFANQLLVLPLLGQLVLGDTAVFRTLTSDISETIALALAVLISTHLIAFSISPVRHIGNFIKIKEFFQVRSFADFGNATLNFFLGMMDVIGEMAKLFSLSFRLFGNVFAGELVILVIASLSFATKLFVPVPFMALSIFSGLVQALVFTMLSIQFMAGTINGVEDADDADKGKDPDISLYPAGQAEAPIS